MTTRKVLLSAFASFMLFIVLLSVFGHSGVLVNRSLAAKLDELSRQEQERRLEIEALEERRGQVSSEAYFDDVALSLGYEREGDLVFYFEDPDVLEVTSSVQAPPDEEPVEVWEGVDSWILALVAAGFWILLLVVMFLVQTFRHGPRGEGDAGRTESGRRGLDEFDWS